MSLERIETSHFTEDILPASCGHDDYTFFIMSDGKGVCDIRDHKDVKDVAKCFQIKSQNGDVTEYYCTIHYHGNDFYDWLNQSAGSIVQELGYKSVEGVSVIELGHEHHVTIKGVLKAVPKPTEPTPTTKPTEPTPTTKPTEPVPTTKPTESTPTSTPAEGTPTTQPSATDGSSEPSGSAPDISGNGNETTAPSVTKPAPSGDNESNGSTVVIIAACIAGAGAIAAAVYFLFIKKK